jgi:Terminase RNaseH-like domain
MKACVMVSWEDVPHLTEEQKKTILAGIPAWQRDSRTKGTPQLGAGAIYQVPESDIVCAPIPIPPHWPRSFGMDVGWNRTAVVWTAIDRDSDTVYQYDEYYRGQAEPSVHAAAIRRRGLWIPGAIDPAAHGRSQKDGEQLFEIYQKLGLNIENAVNAREAGVYAVWERLSQGSYKIFSSCQNTLAEYRLYRRDERGQIVKANDHLMDAMRYNVMTGLSRAKVEPKMRADGQPWFYYAPPPVWSG